VRRRPTASVVGCWVADFVISRLAFCFALYCAVGFL
jgi:hypothetical protein